MPFIGVARSCPAVTGSWGLARGPSRPLGGSSEPNGLRLEHNWKARFDAPGTTGTCKRTGQFPRVPTSRLHCVAPPSATATATAICHPSERIGQSHRDTPPRIRGTLGAMPYGSHACGTARRHGTGAVVQRGWGMGVGRACGVSRCLFMGLLFPHSPLCLAVLHLPAHAHHT